MDNGDYIAIGAVLRRICQGMRLGWRKCGYIDISEEENITALKGARPLRNKNVLIQIKGI